MSGGRHGSLGAVRVGTRRLTRDRIGLGYWIVFVKLSREPLIWGLLYHLLSDTRVSKIDLWRQ